MILNVMCMQYVSYCLHFDRHIDKSSEKDLGQLTDSIRIACFNVQGQWPPMLKLIEIVVNLVWNYE